MTLRELKQVHCYTLLQKNHADDSLKTNSDMTDSEKRHASLLWWNSLPFERKFYKVIEWLKSKGRDTTERHPDTLTGSEIQEVWSNEKF